MSPSESAHCARHANADHDFVTTSTATIVTVGQLRNSQCCSLPPFLPPSFRLAPSNVPLVLCSTSSSSFLNCCGFLCKWYLLLLFLSSLPLFQLNNTIVLTVAVMVVVVAHMCSMSCKPKGKQLSGQVVIFVIGTFSLVIDSDGRVANYLCTQRKINQVLRYTPSLCLCLCLCLSLCLSLFLCSPSLPTSMIFTCLLSSVGYL